MHAAFHTAILTTSFAATIAVGLASAAIFTGDHGAAAKSDRLPFVASDSYRTVETRTNGMSVLERVPLRNTD